MIKEEIIGDLASLQIVLPYAHEYRVICLCSSFKLRTEMPP